MTLNKIGKRNKEEFFLNLQRKKLVKGYQSMWLSGSNTKPGKPEFNPRIHKVKGGKWCLQTVPHSHLYAMARHTNIRYFKNNYIFTRLSKMSYLSILTIVFMEKKP